MSERWIEDKQWRIRLHPATHFGRVDVTRTLSSIVGEVLDEMLRVLSNRSKVDGLTSLLK